MTSRIRLQVKKCNWFLWNIVFNHLNLVCVSYLYVNLNNENAFFLSELIIIIGFEVFLTPNDSDCLIEGNIQIENIHASIKFRKQKCLSIMQY